MAQKRRLTRDEAKAQTRRALLEAAAEQFARHGFNGVSIDAVAEAAGYTKGAVYAHFSNKDELYLALLDDHLSGEAPGATEQLESGASIESFAGDLEEALPGQIESTRDWGSLTFEFILHSMRDDSVRGRLAERFVRARDDYAASLEKRYAANGEDPPIEIEKLATALMAFENGLSMIGFVCPEIVTDGVYSATLARLLDP
ncbi:MAG: TetR/AcrR family transcriptional regulator [Spirochaetaceae bacterium]|nr:MAG: TetR/AcrR family transcriptional regulator [Spirochaetaceae bacterium]